MSEKSQIQIELEAAREQMKNVRALITTLTSKRKAEVEENKAKRQAAKNSRELAKAEREAARAERQKVKEEAKANRLARLQAAIAKLQSKEEAKKTNSAVRRAQRRPGKVTVTKGE